MLGSSESKFIRNPSLNSAPSITVKFDLVLLTLFGNGLGLIGLWLMSQHARTWQAQSVDPDIEPGLKIHLRGQYRRRMQMSGILASVGFLLNLSNELLFPWQRLPGLFAVYVLVLLVLLLWLMLLAFLDMLGNRVVHGQALARLRAQQRELEESLIKARRAPGPTHLQTKPPTTDSSSSAEWN